ncbi:ankyrin [Apiospora phragmitis]|uniref:Ankyrin n=1 Tax=Apiospora phragmitis TaxID=2905665 RepID=A0ABR1U770_9PEZI
MSGETRFTHPVVVVCEVPGNSMARDAITLYVEATSSPTASVLFTFSIDTPDDRARAPSLQITADRISSLTRTVHDHITQLIDSRSPPCIDLVRQKLGTTRNLTRLRFQLRTHGHLVNPVEGVALSLRNLGAADAITSLAGTSVFSVYMPHDALQKATYNIFYRAVRPYLDSAAALLRPELLPTVRQDNCRIHNEDYNQEGHTSSPPKYVNENEGRTPQSHESDNDTVAVTTPSGYGPPGDDEELPGSEGSSNLGTISKRGRLWSPDAEAFVETESPSPSANLDQSESRLGAIEARMKLQDERIEKLEAENRQCKSRNVELERRVAELEGCVRELQGLECRVDQLGEQHEVLEETVANLDVHQGELDADCSRIGLELAEIRDMSRDALIDDINDKVQESLGEVVDMYREELKRKLISALQEA